MKDRTMLMMSVIVLIASVFCTAAITYDQDVEGATSPSSLCSVSFVPNLSGDGHDTSQAHTYDVLKGNTIELPTKEFTNTNHVLIGWTVGSVDGTELLTGAEYTVNENTTFYAKWVETNVAATHQSDWDSNLTVGGEFDKTYSFDSFWSVSDPRIISGPDWLHAEVNGDGDAHFYGNAESSGSWYVEVLFTHNIDTYRLWWQITVPSAMDKEITYTYDGNEGSNITLSSFTLRAGTTHILADASVTSRAGYDLWGWTIRDGAGNQPTYALGSAYTASEELYDRYGANQTISAHWEPMANILILNASGADGISAQVVREGDILTFPATTDYKMPGYVLKGWFLDSDENAIYAPGYQYKVGSAAKGAIYACAYWVAEGTETYKVTYNVNGGEDYSLSQEVEEGKSVVLPTEGFTKKGFTLVGWSEKTEDDEPSLAGQAYTPTKSVTLYAIYRESSSGSGETYSVTFNVNGGTGVFQAQEVEEGGYATKPSTDPVKERHIFMGWFQTGSATAWDFASKPVTQNISLVANWREHFTVTTDGNIVTLNVDSYFSRLGISTVDWGDGKIQENVSTKVTHTYDDDASGTITVTTKQTGASTTYVSSYKFSIGEGGGTPLKAVGKITDNGDGTWTLSAEGSTGMDSYAWYVNDEFVGDKATVTLENLEDGRYDVKLVVDADGAEKPSEWKGSFTVGDTFDYTLIIYAVVIVVVIIALIMVARNFL